jgi:hypothetical protein
MGKFEIAFAVGAIASALALGGVLYALYPEGFTVYSESAIQFYDGTLPITGTPTVESNSTANQNSTDATQDTGPPAPSDSGY